MKKRKHQVNYKTQWIHPDLKKDQNALYFEENTPIEYIVNEIENQLNLSYGPHITISYEKSLKSFYDLYRNLIPCFKGWQVLYKKPNSCQKKPYQPISKKIAYKSRKNSISKGVDQKLKRLMLWKHKLNSHIEPLTLGPVPDSKTLAETLEIHLQQLSFKNLCESELNNINNLVQTFDELKQYDLKIGELKKYKDVFLLWQQFSQNVELFYNRWKLLNRTIILPNVTACDIHDFFNTSKKHTHTKGWSVTFLDEKNN